MAKQTIFDLIEEDQPKQNISPKTPSKNGKKTIFDLIESEPPQQTSPETTQEKPSIRRKDYSGPRAGSLPDILGQAIPALDYVDRENPQFNQAPVVPVAKSVIRGVGTTIADVARESRKGPREGSLGHMLGFGDEKEPEDYPWGAKLRQALPEESSSYPLRIVESQARIASRPESIVFGLPGFMNALAAGATGETAESVGLGKTGRAIAEFATAPAAALSRYAPKFWSLLQSFTKKGKANSLVEGIDINTLDPSEYKFFKDEVFPELKQVWESEFNAKKEVSLEKHNREYNQKLANVKAKHLNALEEQAEIEALNVQYENEIAQIEAANNAEKQGWEAQQKTFDEYNSRSDAALNAIRIQGETQHDLSGRITRNAPDTGIRPAPLPEANPTLENRALNHVSPNEIHNKTHAGETQRGIIQSVADHEYRQVNQRYAEARELNNPIVAHQEDLAQHLQETIANINRIAHPSPPQVQLRTASQALLNQIATVGENGIITGTRPINNQVLYDQGQALRYYMDYEYAHANPKGIFNPTLRAIDNAAEGAAVASGNQEAALANRVARDAYREWSDLYNNDYINPYRSRTNHDYIKLFDSSLNIDNFTQVERVLNRSNYGSVTANATRRALVQKNLKPFLEDPVNTNIQDFNRTMRELEPVINPQQSAEIRAQYLADKRGSGIRGREITKPKEPGKPLLQGKPTKPKERKTIKEVEIPNRKEFKNTPEMNEISRKLEMTPEQIMKKSDSASGLESLRNDLKNTPKGEELFNKIGKYKMREMFYGGKIHKKLTGQEIYDIANNGENFAIMSEIMGEEATKDFLQASYKISGEPITKELLKKTLKDYSIIKTLVLVGLL